MNEKQRFSARSDGGECQFCEEWTDRIIAFFSGELNDEDALIEHLADCSDCRETVGILYRGSKHLGEKLRREPENNSNEAAAEIKPAKNFKARRATGG